MPNTIFRRLDLPADHQDPNHHHDRNEFMSKIEAVVEMDSTDSSTAEGTNASRVHVLTRGDRLDGRVTMMLGEEISTNSAVSEVREEAVNESNLPSSLTDKGEDHAEEKDDGGGGVANATTSQGHSISSTTRSTGVRAAGGTPITPESTEDVKAIAESKAATKITHPNIIDEMMLEALQQPKLDDERPKEKKGTTNNNKNQFFLRPRRGRIVSLDRGRGIGPFNLSDEAGYQESVSARTDGTGVGRRTLSHDGGRRPRAQQHYHHHSSHHHDNDDESSSDDDSSYFATDLPSPSSARSFVSGAASAPARTGPFQLQKQQSDASLSFSDESDDGGSTHTEQQQQVQQQQQQQQESLPTRSPEDPTLDPAVVAGGSVGVHMAPIVNPNRAVADMHMYPQQRITRMHSVSSLVSSASSGDDDSSSSHEQSRGSRPRSSTADSLTSMSTNGGREWTLDGDGGLRPSSHLTEVSGRRSPVMGHHANSGSNTPSSHGPNFYFSSSSPNIEQQPQQQPGAAAPADQQPQPHLYHQHSMQRSPPPIQQGYMPPSGMLVHPLPQQPMSNAQVMAWIAQSSGPDPVASGVDEYTGSPSVQPAKFCVADRVGVLPPGSGGQLNLAGFRNMGDRRHSSKSGSLVYNYSEDEDNHRTIFDGYSPFMAANLTSGQVAATALDNVMGGIPESNQLATVNGSSASSRIAVLGQLHRNEAGLPESDKGVDGTVDGMKRDEVAVVEEATSADGANCGGDDKVVGASSGRQTFKVYWQRWIMLMYMSVLNLLSDWTCYSVAPISLLTEEAFGRIDPERLVVIFLVANAISTACEPIILARLGLRRTVLFGALLLMVGSIVKSGGLPPILQPNLEFGHAQWSLYIGFFLVGLSQPLYQCTPALLSASWFPEKERTMATGVALNANQVGIGFAFIFGTLLVAKADDIPAYFGLLSQISTVVFIGTLIQFDDAPPTPPSSSARAMRGDLNFNIPRMSRFRSMVQDVGNKLSSGNISKRGSNADPPSSAGTVPIQSSHSSTQRRSSSKATTKQSAQSSMARRGSSTRRRSTVPRSQAPKTDSGMAPPSSAHYGSTSDALTEIARVKTEAATLSVVAQAPSPSLPGRVSNQETDTGAGSPNFEEEGMAPQQGQNQGGGELPIGPGQGMGYALPGIPYPYGYGYPPQYPYPYYDPRIQQQLQQQVLYQQQYYQQQQQQQQQSYMGHMPPLPPSPHPMPYYPPPPMMAAPPPPYQQFPGGLHEFDPYYDMYGVDPFEEGTEPIVTITPHHCDIDIRDDQVIRSLHACMIRPGFSHALAAFTVSGIVINTLSTYMDYLVRLNGAPRSYTGIVGGTFQFVIMISSLIVGKQTDKTRAYYSVTIAMLVLGAFSLAECGVSLDSDRGGDLRWTLIVVAALVGPLQPVSTELGVEVAYPLSENTVLVIQQLFSNLLSAIFIPFFKALKDIGATRMEGSEVVERPDYTFSFYLLIVLHTGVTVYFATFNGKYLRYEHELLKEAEEDREDAEAAGEPATVDERNPTAAFYPVYANQTPPPSYQGGMQTNPELQPLMQTFIV